jgi:hypothetical protein
MVCSNLIQSISKVITKLLSFSFPSLSTDCSLVNFVQPYINETIPVVFLPTMGQLIHPGAQITFSGKPDHCSTVA